MESFEVYRERLEKAVVTGVEKGLLGVDKPVPVYPGKLAKQKFGVQMGKEIDTDHVVVVDYYGFMKKSRGFSVMVKEVKNDLQGKQVKTIAAPVVHFNSVRLEMLAKIDPGLVSEFGDFKKEVLDARGFKHRYKP